jgi:hypothetical protein
MLGWLSKLFRRSPEAPPQRRFASLVRVSHDEKIISVNDGEGGVATLSWQDVGNVTVLTTDTGPFEIDLFWVLTDQEGRRSVTVPMGAEGEHALLQAMQARLSGFDNMAVVEAMSSTENGVFQIWPAAEMA